MSNPIEVLDAAGCIASEWFMRDHIPRHAEFYGLSFSESYERVLGELVTLKDIQAQNFRDMLEAGTAQKALRVFGERGTSGYVGEDPLVVEDNMIYRMVRDEATNEWIEFDPLNPLSIANTPSMKRGRYPVCVAVGRPNKNRELFLMDGFDVDDYDVVVRGYNRIIEAKKQGLLPHLDSHLKEIYIPYTLGDFEYPYDPDEIRSGGPVEYESVLEIDES